MILVVKNYVIFILKNIEPHIESCISGSFYGLTFVNRSKRSCTECFLYTVTRQCSYRHYRLRDKLRHVVAITPVSLISCRLLCMLAIIYTVP